MKVSLKNNSIFLLIPQDIFDRLETLVGKNNQLHPSGKLKLKMDFLVFSIDLIQKKAIEYKDKLDRGHVRLKAEYFKTYCGNSYKLHLDFLRNNNFISRTSYSVSNSFSFGYKVIVPKINKKSSQTFNYLLYDNLSFTFNNKIKNGHEGSKQIADKKTAHLTKWVNSDSLEFDYSAAIAYLHNKNNHLNNSQLFSNRYAIESLKNKMIYYKREGKDGRLHSNYTCIAKDLRKFINYKGETLVSLDLKSSQPYFLCGLLNLMINKGYDNIEDVISNLKPRLRNKMIDMLSVMIPKTLEPIVKPTIHDLIDLVINKDIYLHVGSNFSAGFLDKVKCNKTGKLKDQFYSEVKQRKIKKTFIDIRDYSKKSMLEYLYCSPRSTERRIKEIRQIMPPVVNNIIDFLKAEDKKLKYSKNDFPIILQNIEAYCILDKITKEISNSNPDLFMLTIHDSIVVTESNVNHVKKTMEVMLTDIFGITPSITEEPWKQT